MKKILMKSLGLLIMMGVILASCNPEEDDRNLTGKLGASEIDFQVIQDYDIDTGGNTVILINNTPGTIAVWDYGTGKSKRKIDTVRFAFKGDYVIKRVAITEGGQVELEPITVTVTDDNLNYVNDPLWTALTGGVGNTKKWYMDYNADSETKYFKAPHYFSGKDVGYSPNSINGEYSCLVDGSDFCWVYEPSTPGDDWVAIPHDFGYMEFSLDGGPFVTAHHNTYDGSAWTNEFNDDEGTFFLDINKKTLTLNNVRPIRNSWVENDIQNWTDYRIISLTEDAMQIGAFHSLKDELVIFNFISEEYSDAWVPADLPDPTPPIDLNGGTTQDLLAVTSSKTWALSTDTPFDWTDLNGTLLNGWTSVDDYPDWTGFSAEDQASIANVRITFVSDGTVITTDNDGTEMEGTYAADNDTNVITFTDITPSFAIGDSWARVETTAQNQWKIVKTQASGTTVTDIWFGKRDEAKDEYMVFHFVLGDTSVDPDDEVRQILTSSSTWKLDSNRTYDTTISGTDIAIQGPVIYSDFATWSWNPLPGEQYAAGDPGVDYGSMTFNEDGTLVVNQLTDTGNVTLNGNWSVTNGKLSITADLLHPWTADSVVADWTNIETYKIESGALLLQALRDPDLSGEDEFLITWVFVPGS